MPRFLFVDFPLGSPCGEPNNVAMQRQIMGLALDLFESATAPRSTVQAPFSWPKGEAWKATVFTAAQPFLSGQAIANWEARKQRYRDAKAET